MSGTTVHHQFKSLPPSWHGLDLADAARLRTPLFGPDAASPIMVLRGGALEHNLRLMAEYARGERVLMAPHGKTTMAPRLVRRQLDLGAWAVTAANTAQARVFVDHGAPRVLIANEVVDAAGLRWLAETTAGGKTQMLCYVDSVAGARLLEHALADVETSRPLDVLLEVGFPGGRAGCRDVETAIKVAAAVTATPRLRLAGTAGYEGIIAHDRQPESLDAVRRFLRTLRQVTERLIAQEYLSGPDPVVVSAGGSAYFDLVVEELRDNWPAGIPVQLLIRPGAYVSHDSLFYVELSPFSGEADPERRFKPALELWAQVLSRPEPGLAILNAGKRDAPVTEGMPVPFAARRGQSTLDVAGLDVVDMNDQHTYLRVPADHPLAVADWVGLGISHPCLAFDRWQAIPVVDETDSVVDVVRTYF